MSTFSDSALSFLQRRDKESWRQSAWSAFEAVGLPTTNDEVWRYAPLSSFQLDNYQLAETAEAPFDAEIDALTAGGALVLRALDGELLPIEGTLHGVTVSVRTENPDDRDDFVERYRDDAFALLNRALSPDVIVIDVADHQDVAGTMVVVHQIKAGAAFPSVRVNVGNNSSFDLVECYLGGDDALVAPVSEYDVGENAKLTVATYQRLATSAWHVARTAATLRRDARLHQSIVGLGGQYNRARNDATFVGPGSSNVLHTTFLGAGSQVHDFRTHQLHNVGRTKSTLLSKGAVADHSRSVYTGLIEIEKGAKRTDARQRNLNLLLSPDAHADTVPNLDIRENDVVCAHASSVGPLDEMQRWYLESRGVDRLRAERLLVQGFFNEMTSALPSAIATMVDDDVARVLATTQLGQS